MNIMMKAVGGMPAAFEFDDEPGTVIDIGIHSFKQLIPMMKKGKVRNPYAYYYRICVNAFDDWLLEVVRRWRQEPYVPGRLLMDLGCGS